MNRFFFTGNATPVEGSEFEDEYTVKVPSEEEVRIVGIRMRNCNIKNLDRSLFFNRN